jgi:ubiquinone/menaquinone biosynthesis C-methylase UbiE
MGFFTLELARLVGSSGRVVAVDVQAGMLNGLRRRAVKAGVGTRIDTRLATPSSLGIDDLMGKVEFGLAFAMVHEVPSVGEFFAQMAGALKPGGRLLFAEPSGHVHADRFAVELKEASGAGLQQESRVSLRGCHASLLRKA